MSQEIIFTTLPHERTEIDGEQFLKLSVFVSIKLGTPNDTTLSQFEDIISWPQKILDADFKFKLQNGAVVQAIDQNQLIDADLFRNIFHKDIRVDDFKQDDLSLKRIHSFPMVHIKEFVLSNYKQIAIESPKRMVTPENFVDETKFGAISRNKLDPQNIDRVVTPGRKMDIKANKLLFKKEDEGKDFKNRIKRDKFMRFSSQMKPKDDFVELRQFHKLDKKVVRDIAFQIKKPSFEFHDIMAVVNSYPQIMRKLGIVLDFLISYNSTIPSAGTISLVPDALVFEEEGTSVSIPATAYTITSSGFYIGDKPNTIFKQGYVKINTNEFSVIQIDADGAALKTNNMTENKVQQIARFYETRAELAVSRNLKFRQVQDVEPPEEEGLPFIRSAGIAITKNGMAEHLFSSINMNVVLQQEFIKAKPKIIQVQRKASPGMVALIAPLRVKVPETILFSTDIIQGYRMDIAYKEEPDKWYSLHQRQDEYSST